MQLEGKRIVVGVGGGIAAFKAVVLVRELQRRGADVRVAMTSSAARFIGPITFTGLTGKPAVTDLWDPSLPGEVHVELGTTADAIVIAPATANLLARAAAGMADDVVLATIACAACPIVFAPAMHENMWLADATQRNARQLEQDGAVLVGPVAGALATGEGMGRMAEPEAIADAVERLFTGQGDLAGRTVLISAGPTIEDIDPVRYITNRSSGRMGFALARAALGRGAKVIMVCGPTSVPAPNGVEQISVRSALEMQHAIDGALGRADVVVMTAAVADYRPAQAATSKIKKSGASMSIELVKNPDILSELGARRTGKRPVLVGFAMETDQLAVHARSKLVNKRADLIVANHAEVAFGGDNNQAILVSASGDEELPIMSKLELADRIWNRVLTLL